jgi:hypothetical protein
MGQGRFHVDGAPIHVRWPPPAAATLCERMARDEILTLAREALARAGAYPGVDDVEKSEFLEALSYRLPQLRRNEGALLVIYPGKKSLVRSFFPRQRAGGTEESEEGGDEAAATPEPQAGGAVASA